MESYITQEELLEAMTANADGEATRVLVVQTLERLGWAAKARFTQGEVIQLLQTLSLIGKEQILASEDPAVVASRDHLVPLLDALESHAFPVLAAQA